MTSSIRYLLTDIDDTLTDHGHLGPEAYSALWDLHEAGIRVVPVTGRPAGWCELIARQWPVAGVVGENGGFYFRYHNSKMKRFYAVPEKDRLKYRQILDEKIAQEILKEVPGSAMASDQFCRLLDLAIDFCEDVMPLPDSSVQKIVAIFRSHGATAKVSSIHVNGWFGNYDKLTTSKEFLKREFQVADDVFLNQTAFVGDSPNDEPMFAALRHTFAVANISKFLKQLQAKPATIAAEPGGKGFASIAQLILQGKK